MKKLIEIQAELKAPKNQRNNFGKYNYRSCEDILEAVKPLLKKHGLLLTISDAVIEQGGLVFIESTAWVNDPKDKEVIVSVTAQAGINPDRKGMDIAQSFGSSSSYARKYALNGLFLIDDTKDADATNDHGKVEKKVPTKVPTPIGQRIIVTDGDKVFLAIVKAVVEGKGTIEQAKGKYNISEDVEGSLKLAIQSLKEVV